jgi:hypothetical protein
MHDLGRVPTDREQHFGVLRLDGSRKPSWSVLRTFATAAHENVRGAPSAHATVGPGR